MCTNEKNTLHILRILRRSYPRTPFAELNRRDPFRVLISCVISQRTRDEQTFRVTERLFNDLTEGIGGQQRQYQNVEVQCRALLSIPVPRLLMLLRESGFYRQKAMRIRAICRHLLEECGGRVPDTLEELLKLPGVGRKTANIVLSMAYGKPAIAVDTHVHRISNRLGWVRTRRPEDTEAELIRTLPRRWWFVVNSMMVQHGQNICLPRRPRCEICPVVRYCKKVV